MEKIQHITVNFDHSQSSILFGDNIFKKIGEIFKNNFPISSKIMIITDDNVAPLYLKNLCNMLNNENFITHYYILPAGEISKNFKQLQNILNNIFLHNFLKSDLIIALGGGVIGDIAAFAASIAKRGMNFINIPTSLLAQVDASIGGKTAINSEYGKNLIGSFHQPKLVITDPKLLNSLPNRHLLAGYAEVVKYALISDINFFNWLEKNNNYLLQDTIQRKQLILHSIKTKLNIVTKDEKEKNIRALLNFGHTFAHILEAYYNYDEKIIIHGEAVSLGMLLALKFSKLLNYISKEEIDKLTNHLKIMQLPTSLNEIKGKKINKDEWWNYLLQDKKNYNNKFKFILLKQLGTAFIAENIPENKIKEFFNKL
ncbi:3-dehydroquinate synthase [Bartonella sp. DGB1]|uniref:3-dehydroquinate synthase n=1 Tax=Bartonella sp. DGB1 TaxID=3239807 RepID=UPI0035254F31